MKSKEELNELKEEVETVNKKLAELSEEELEQVSGGVELPQNVPFHPHGVIVSCPTCNTRLGRWIVFSDEQRSELIKSDFKCPVCGWYSGQGVVGACFFDD